MELEAGATYVIGNGLQLWTASVVHEDGNQYIETSPEFTRNQTSRRSLVTPELLAKLAKVWDGAWA